MAAFHSLKERSRSLVGFQEAVTTEMSEDPFADGKLEALQELVGEGGGFVEAEAGLRMRRILSRVTLNLLEETVHDAEMIVEVRVQRRAEAVEKADGPEGGRGRSRWAGLPEGSPEGPEQDMKDGAGGPGSVVEEGPEAFGDGEDELAQRHMGNDVVHQVSCSLGHALGVL